jgi:uncharacterized phage protein (TIGR01671 family)
MRKYKFKIWDIERKRMYHLLEDGWSFGTCECDRAVSWEDVFAEKDIKDKLIPLQYTGLRDKNEKEIYEGDVVKVHPFSYENGFYSGKVGEIRYLYGAFGFYKEDRNEKFIFNPLHLEIEFDVIEHYEVIGNIFDNSELLKEDTK